MNQKWRKDVEAFFRIKAGHYRLAERLHRMGFLNRKECQICCEGILNAKHLTSYSGLNSDAQVKVYLYKENRYLYLLYYKDKVHLFNLQRTVRAWTFSLLSNVLIYALFVLFIFFKRIDLIYFQ